MIIFIKLIALALMLSVAAGTTSFFITIYRVWREQNQYRLLTVNA